MIFISALSIGVATALWVHLIWDGLARRKIEARWHQLLSLNRPKKKRSLAEKGAAGAVSGSLLIVFFPDIWWLVVAGGGFMAAFFFFKKAESKRKEKWRQLTDVSFFLDLLSLGHSAGLSFDDAWARAGRHVRPGPFQQQVRRLSQSFQLGRSRRSALKEIAAQMRHPSLVAVWVLIQQGLEKGFPLKGILLEQTTATRQILNQEIEARANTLSIRLLFPILFFIFPCLFIIIFAPFIVFYLKVGY